jgi:hypothetical protein
MRMQGAFPGRARVSSDAPEATENDSRKHGNPPGLSRLMPTVGILRLVLTAAGLLGALALLASAFTNIIEIKVLTTSALTKPPEDLAQTGWDRHSVAPVLLAGFALVMIGGAVLRHARPAILSIAAIGIAALAIGVLSDARHIHDTGQVGDLYEDASADAATGFYLETLGGALLLICGGGLLILSGAHSARAEAPRERDPEPEPEPPGEKPEGWFA